MSSSVLAPSLTEIRFGKIVFQFVVEFLPVHLGIVVWWEGLRLFYLHGDRSFYWEVVRTLVMFFCYSICNSVGYSFIRAPD